MFVHVLLRTHPKSPQFAIHKAKEEQLKKKKKGMKKTPIKNINGAYATRIRRLDKSDHIET